jgi:hypothetical protein
MTTDVWDFYGQYAEADRSSLNERDRQVLAICDFRQEVNSGGFDSYFRYWGGDTALTAMAGLPKLLGSPWGDLFGEAIALFGVPYPLNADDRAEKIDSDSLEATLGEFDQRFYKLETSTAADAGLTEVISTNRN